MEVENRFILCSCLSRLNMLFLRFCVTTTLLKVTFCCSALLTSQPTRHDKYLIRMAKDASEMITVECSSTWNIATHQFDIYVEWVTTPPSNSYDLFFIYNGKSVGDATINDGTTMHSYSVTPTVVSGELETTVQHIERGECFSTLTIPPADPISSIQVLSFSINVTNNVASVADISLNWSIPESPTGSNSDLTYEIRIGDNETIPDSASVYSITNIEANEAYQKGSIFMINSIPVMSDFTYLYIQIRSLYSITLGMTVHTISSNWSVSQPLQMDALPIATTSTVSSTSSVSSPLNTKVTDSSTSQVLLLTSSSHSTLTSSATNNSPVTDSISQALPSTTAAHVSRASDSPMATHLFTTSPGTASPSVVPTIQPSSEFPLAVIIIIAIVVGMVMVVFIVVILCCICVLLKNKSSTEDILMLVDPHIIETTSVTGDKWEVPYECVHLGRSIGSGGFGEVFEAVVKGHTSAMLDIHLQRSNHNHLVAVKTLRDDASDYDKEQFLKEIELMKRISENSNPHVVNMVGASVSENHPKLLILEYLQHGDLLTYLKYCREENAGNNILADNGLEPLQQSDVASFAYQIASGMEYLASMDLVHRDLACRNILLGEGRKLKITDFGLSRQVESMYVAQPTGRFPVRWMAIESIVDRTFTTNSDVWSFGVTLWEIGSLGEVPYSHIGNEHILHHLRDGKRLERPAEYITEEIYSKMRRCWSVRPSDRPSFSRLRTSFDSILSRGQYYIDLNT